ncbi:MAG: tRNA lysidine(34) synthetase TilS [Myxococcales bacterium]|nr:tRNA lysidine(34) synthetase TilS [Myxococcales bacterium]
MGDESGHDDRGANQRRARRHPSVARALGVVRRTLNDQAEASGEPLAAPWIETLRGQGVLVACSGGRDSVALVGVLQLLARALQLRLAIGHVDHGLRPESAEEAFHVRALAEACGVPVRVIRLATLDPGPGLPARARAARRAALEEMARERGASWIALGHTATDQAETALMHLVRGAGLDGLAAMPAVDAPWIRPLLGLTREQTRSLCERLGLAYVDDPSNLDEGHFRVRLRERILPMFAEVNPQCTRSLATLSVHARDAELALERWAAREELERRRSPGRWSHDGLHALPRAIRTRLIRRICLSVGADIGALGHAVIAEIDQAVVARGRALGTTDAALAPRTWPLRPAIVVRLDRGGLWVGPSGPRA